jgi:L-asparaginase
MPALSRTALVVHGGAGARAPARRSSTIRRHLQRVCGAAFQRLQEHPALDTVLWAVARLEEDPLFNAGTGSVLQRDGRARLSASVMDGSRRRFAGVLNIEAVRHPVLVAATLLDEPDRILAGREATRWARALGVAPWSPVTPSRRRQWQAQRRLTQGTVGAVALDAQGRLAAATSSGGKSFAWPGRVSDSGTPAGNYADERVALSCTGLGEDILEEGIAVRLAQQVESGMSLRGAMRALCVQLSRRVRRMAVIGIDRGGRWAWASTLPVLYGVGRAGHRRLETF